MKILLKGTVGSQAYGLSHADSDNDYAGVFIADTKNLFGMNVQETVTQSIVRHVPYDETLHELGKAFNLFLKCNPTVSEILWLNNYVVEDEMGKQLVENRKIFLSTTYVKNAYGGYATAQMRKIANRVAAEKAGYAGLADKRIAKHTRHCFRLLLQSQQLLSTGELIIDVSEHKDRLFALGEQALLNIDEIAQHFETEIAKLDSTRSVLPEVANYGKVNQLLVELRMQHARNENAL